MERHILRPGPNDAGKRIDRVLRVSFPQAALSAIFAALRTGDIRVGGKKVAQAYRVEEGDEISVKKTAAFFLYEAAAQKPAAPKQDAAFRIAERIIFEDDNFLVLDKPWGMLTHGPGSLAEEAAAYLVPRLPPSLAFSPAPLHRLDRNTSGLIFFSKSIKGARAFSAALAAGNIRKTYYALLEGRAAPRETWTDNLVRDSEARLSRGAPETQTGKTAVSEVRLLAGGRGLSLCEVVIRTGRTHQIRAQAAAHGHPLAGDRKYGGRPLPEAPRGGAYILHAAFIRLPPDFPAGPPPLLSSPLPDNVYRFLSKAGLLPETEKRGKS